jgi:hypothetical protein
VFFDMFGALPCPFRKRHYGFVVLFTKKALQELTAN